MCLPFLICLFYIVYSVSSDSFPFQYDTFPSEDEQFIENESKEQIEQAANTYKYDLSLLKHLSLNDDEERYRKFSSSDIGYLKKAFQRRFKIENDHLIDTLYDNRTVFKLKSGKRNKKNDNSSSSTLKRAQRDANESTTESIFYREVAESSSKGALTSCFKCSAHIKDYKNSNCYNPQGLPTVNCKRDEVCYMKLLPKTLKRGCINPNNINQTFACNCPLCNDRSMLFDLRYDNEKNWRYHNQIINSASTESKAHICKMCETTGLSKDRDERCRKGKNVKNVYCSYNQLCYTAVNKELNFVKRGCLDKPFYNSYWSFCYQDICNDMTVEVETFKETRSIKENELDSENKLPIVFRNITFNEKLVEFLRSGSCRICFNLFFNILFALICSSSSDLHRESHYSLPYKKLINIANVKLAVKYTPARLPKLN